MDSMTAADTIQMVMATMTGFIEKLLSKPIVYPAEHLISLSTFCSVHSGVGKYGIGSTFCSVHGVGE